MDQLCIVQTAEKGFIGKSDKENEVPRMKDYYAQAEVTLIPINYSLSEYTEPFLLKKKEKDAKQWRNYGETVTDQVVVVQAALSAIINSA
jgi:hypothetical protein